MCLFGSQLITLEIKMSELLVESPLSLANRPYSVEAMVIFIGILHVFLVNCLLDGQPDGDLGGHKYKRRRILGGRWLRKRTNLNILKSGSTRC